MENGLTLVHRYLDIAIDWNQCKTIMHEIINRWRFEWPNGIKFIYIQHARINLPLFCTVVQSNICMFLSCRPFVAITTLSTGLVGVEVNSTPTRPVDNVVIATKGLQDRNLHIFDWTTVENKGKLILIEMRCMFSELWAKVENCCYRGIRLICIKLVLLFTPNTWNRTSSCFDLKWAYHGKAVIRMKNETF